MVDDDIKWFGEDPEAGEGQAPGRPRASPSLAELLARAIGADGEADQPASSIVRGGAEPDAAPVVGIFDHQGIVWPVEDVRVLDGVVLPGRALVRLSFRGGIEASFVLPLRDFAGLLEACHLRPAESH